MAPAGPADREDADPNQGHLTAPTALRTDQIRTTERDDLMSIPNTVRQTALEEQRRWYALFGAPQLDLDEADQADRAWARHARCGQWNTDAPDPEDFFPLNGDSP